MAENVFVRIEIGLDGGQILSALVTSASADALERLHPSAEDGLVELTPGEIRATALGRIFLRNLAMPFDAYLPAATERPIFSRTL